MKSCWIALLFIAAIGEAHGADPAALGVYPLPYQSKDKTLGTVNCANSTCHGSISEFHDSKVLQTEYVTWSRLDKHTRTYQVLLNAQSRRIAKNLGLPKPAQESSLCLDCHAHDVPATLQGERFKLSDGVVCESCHGPAERWIKTHLEPNPSHARNIEAGLYPTDAPIARARLCLSCHFGNSDKFVTHRLMGAGHPRLSFELETFSMIEPAHFRLTRAENSDLMRWDGVKIWAIGQALAVSETLSILLDPKRGHDGLFPELVLFDCHACHHPMSEQRWKPHAEFGLRQGPGIARLNDSNLLMMRVIARQIDPALGERVTVEAARLQAASAGQGDVEAQARSLRSLSEEVAVRISTTSLSPAFMRGVAVGLVDEGLSGNYSDYAGAEQATMSIGSVVDYINRQHMLKAPADVNASLGRLNATLVNDEHYRPADYQAELRTLRTLLART
ncbi:MAG: multiheme c-type cytochrome [Burkholderiaceae bacterium]|jgi:hypothetical protein